jgi:hypothetical protein
MPLACPRQRADELIQTNPFSVAAVLRHKEASDRSQDIELRGNLAVIGDKGGSLGLVDLGKPTAPQLLWYRRDLEKLKDPETILV